MSQKQTIPTLSLNDFFSNTPAVREKFIHSLGEALHHTVFFALTDHGVDQSLIEKAYQMSEALFSLEETQKRKYEIEGWGGQRGYTSFGKEHAKDESAPDLKEFWHVGREDGNYLKNVWPDEIPAFHNVMTELYRKLEMCSMHLLDACSAYLNQEKGFLREIATLGNSILRIIHYPPIPNNINPKSVRAAAHEDINLITLLCESTAEGLELLQRDGTWLPIHSLPGQIIVDSGDMIQNLTNGLLKSTTHRVVNPSNDRERRFSMPFFVHPRSEVSLNPIVDCIEKTGGQQKFPNITAGQYLDQRLSEIGLS